jgi:signal transduction histidine kinase
VGLRTRLVTTAAYLLVVMAITLAIPLGANIEGRAVSEFRSSVMSNAAILAARVSDMVVAAEARDLRSMGRIAEETSDQTEARVVIVDGRGEVLVDTSEIAAVGERYATRGRPEFSVALFEGRIDARERFSDAVGDDLVVVSVPVVDHNRVVGAVRMSQAMGVVNESVWRSRLGLGLLALAIVLVGLGVAWFLADTLVRPVRRLETAASRLEMGELEARADEEGPREISSLARSFNRMAAALSANLHAQRDFLANASHQLRTPLTGLRLRLEALGEQDSPLVKDQAAKAEKEVDRLNLLVDDLLALARASSDRGTGSEVDLSMSAREAAERWRGPAQEKHQSIELDAAEGVAAWTDPSDVAHILDNLIENAIRYGPADTAISVGVRSRNGTPLLSVSNDGPGMATEERDHLFERFYRGSTGKQTGPGTGLGLAIVAELARRWNGKASLADGPGTRIEVTLGPTIP